MKYITISLAALSGIIAVLWLTIGGSALIIVLSVSSIMLVIISAFSLGIWFSHKSIQLGAKLAIEAQSNNDQWDTAKMNGLAKFGESMLKLKGGNNNNEYPLLEDSSLDGQFMITGIEE